ncbi:MAG: SRPBCC domain-containing protein [Polyangiaceae bacterium]
MSLTQFGEQLELRSEVEIARAPQHVWDVLVDLTQYARWNPFIVRASGQLAIGATLRLISSPPGGREVKLTREVQALDEAKELVWSGGYGWGLLLRSRQRFQLMPIADGARTRLLVAEDLKGPGVTGTNPLALNVARGTALMNQALKRECERSEPSQ